MSESVADAPVERFIDRTALNHYTTLASIDVRKLSVPDMLINIGAAIKPSPKTAPVLTNAGVLLFSRQPNRIIPEAHSTAVRYEGTDKFSIIDRRDLTGNVIAPIDASLEFPWWMPYHPFLTLRNCRCPRIASS